MLNFGKTKIQPKNSLGFTAIELMVVVAIIAVMAGLVIADYNSQRSERTLRIAQNELVTNVRKVQSYSLFSQSLANNKPAQYFVLKFSTSTPDRYYIQAISDVSSAPTLHTIETVLLPSRVKISGISLTSPIWSPSVGPSCALLAFKSPYAKLYASSSCNPVSVASVYTITNTDDYRKLIDYSGNVSPISADADTVITLSIVGSTSTKKVLIKGVVGLVCPTQDGIACSF